MYRSERKQPGGNNLGYKLDLLFDATQTLFLKVKKMAQICK